jgi:hypothetical protein
MNGATARRCFDPLGGTPPQSEEAGVTMRIYGEITKVEALDDGTIRVVGIASSGAVDDADEQVAPEAMKAALPAYMRFGALREMHGLQAAGATLSAEVGDDGVTRIEAHVVDPLAVKKVQLGVYKGFSIGGRVLARDPADRKIITKLKLNEISLVDRPCNPEAIIDMWKAQHADPAPTNAEVIAKAIELAGAAGKPGRHTEFVVKAREALLAEYNDDEPPPLLLARVVEPEPVDADEIVDKIGARNSEADLARIQAAHDHMVELGAMCGSGDADKAVGDGPLMKLAAENERLARAIEAAAPQIDDLRRTVAMLETRLEQVAATPAAPKAIAGAVRAVSKGEDGNPGGNQPDALNVQTLAKYLDALPDEELGQLQLRAALRRPISVPGR